MKTRKISLGLLAFVLTICLLSLTCLLLVGKSNLQVADAADLTSENFDAYTDSDTLLGGTKTIRDYASTLHHSTVKWSYPTYTVTADDPIVQIVPKSLFSTKGEHIYIGKEYGFYVNTTADTYKDDGKMEVSPYNNHSEVLVFDITTDTDLKKNTDQIIVKVEPLFQFRYAYIDYRATQFFSDDNIPNNLAFKLKYSIPNGTTYVVPKPVAMVSASFSQTWNYFLKDVSVASTLLNEQALNDTDNGYNASQDDGYFITQFDYKYDGFASKVSNEDKISFGVNVISMLCGAVSFVSGPIGQAAGVLGLLLSVGTTVQSIAVQGTSLNTSVSNGVATAVNKYSTRADQVASYTHPQTGKPCLTKNATCKIQGDDKNGNVWFEGGDSVTATFKVSNTKKLHTRLEREIGLCVVDKKGGEHCKNTTSQQKFSLNDPVYYVADLEANTPLVLLADGDNYFQFTPKHTSDYQFIFGANESADVFVKTSSAKEYTKATLNNNKYSFRMNANTNYHIKIHSDRKAFLTLNITPPTTMQNIAAQSEYLVKLVPPSTGAFTVATSNTAFKISKLYQNTGSNSYANIAYVDRALNVGNADAVLKKNGKYYALLKNTSTASAKSDIKYTACNNTLKQGDNASRNFVGGENFRFYKYVASAAQPNVVFSFDNNADVKNYIQFCAFNQNGDIIKPYSSFYDGYMELANLTAGTYYIGIRTVSNVALQPNVWEGIARGFWKQYVNGKWVELGEANKNVKINLPRNVTYKFGYWIEKTMISYYAFDDAEDQRGLSVENLNIKITLDRFDWTDFTLKAVMRSDDANYNGLQYPNGLTIIPEFNIDEIAVPKIDYQNKIQVELPFPLHVQKITYKLISNTSQSTALDPVDQKPVEANTNNVLRKDFLKMLCGRKATKAKFEIVSVEVESGHDGQARREVKINKQYDINCLCSIQRVEYSILTNELHLYNIRNNPSTNFLLDCTINLVYFANWDPIPIFEKGKKLSRQGGSHITGLNIPVPKANTQYYGLVAENYGTIDGIFVEAVNINGASAEKGGAMSFGAIAAVNHGIISFCHATGKIIVNRRDGAVGGLVGINYGSIYDCSFGQLGTQNDNQLRNSGDTGGIVGRNMGGTVSRCEIYHTYIGANVDQCGNAFGGIVGYSVGGKITDCGSYDLAMGVTNGTLVSGYYPKMGYVAGHMKDNAVMKNCVVAYCSHSFGKLTAGYRKYCYLGKTGSYGLLQNNSVVYYPET